MSRLCLFIYISYQSFVVKSSDSLNVGISYSKTIIGVFLVILRTIFCPMFPIERVKRENKHSLRQSTRRCRSYCRRQARTYSSNLLDNPLYDAPNCKILPGSNLDNLVLGVRGHEQNTAGPMRMRLR